MTKEKKKEILELLEKANDILQETDEDIEDILCSLGEVISEVENL